RLVDLLRELSTRIQELDRAGQLLNGVPELLRLMGDARTELFHYEVRCTYDTPEVAESRRIVEEAKRLAAEGVKEINLISQDTINYGVDLGLRRGLTTLLRELVKINDIRWIRPFYLYPQQIGDELIDLYAGEEKITKYIDMPFQHINDTMLKHMHRLGDKASLTALVDRLRTRIPGLTFRTAFIVGFPGETEAQFNELKQYLIDTEFDRVGLFLYSDEEGTPAESLAGKIDRTLMEERRAELLSLQEGIALKKSRQKIGRPRSLTSTSTIRLSSLPSRNWRRSLERVASYESPMG
ncbi:MAG: hypothetical protein C4294_00310, partial [Nitrospiraceae bacterium]